MTQEALDDNATVQPADGRDDLELETESISSGEVLTEIGESTKAAPSDLERICQSYIDTPAPSKTLIDNFARTMFNDGRVRKICRLRGLKNGVSYDQIEDVIQRTMEVFFVRMIGKIRHADAIYAVVYATANNVSREIVRESAELSFNHDSIDEMAESGSELDAASVSSYVVEDIDLQFDSRMAFQKLSSEWTRVQQGESIMSDTGVFVLDTSPMCSIVAPSAESINAKVSTSDTDSQAKRSGGRGKKGVKAKRELHPLQQELVDICTELKLRNQDFAVLLGIGLPRLSSYIYGRTTSVPDDIMEEARRLRAEQGSSVSQRNKLFDRRMSEIVADWERRLQTVSDEETSQMLGVSTMTIHRWHKDETRPDNTALVRYENVVLLLERRMHSAESAQDKQKSKAR